MWNQIKNRAYHLVQLLAEFLWRLTGLKPPLLPVRGYLNPLISYYAKMPCPCKSGLVGKKCCGKRLPVMIPEFDAKNLRNMLALKTEIQIQRRWEQYTGKRLEA